MISPSSLIVLSSYDPDYLRIAEHLIRRELAFGHRPIVLDVSRSLAAPTDTFHRKTLALFGLDYPGSDLTERFSVLGAEVVDITSLPEETQHPELSDEITEALEVAVRSALITFYRTDAPDETSKAVRRSRRLLHQEGRRVYGAMAFLIEREGNVRTVYVPNGRYPNQRLAELAARSRGVPTLHFEKGETRDGAFLQPYSPQSRIVSQAAVEPTLAGLSPAEVETVADEWLERRAPAVDSRNEFAALWSSDLPDAFSRWSHDGTRVAGFFTSSQDEYQSLGPEWHLHSWQDQFEAFDAVMTKLESCGYKCFIRIHPNLATKAHKSFLQERRNIRRLAARHPDLIVILHDESVNSYGLLDKCDVVVAWDSTIGLEASARGIPVWTAATARYGLTADVRELLSVESVDGSDLTPWDVDALAAKRFIAYLVLRDSQMVDTVITWPKWSLSSPPLGVRLSRILVSGGNPTPIAAVLSLVDVYRHRSARANWRSIRSR